MNKLFIVLSSVFLLLIVLPVSAGNQYVFPDEVVNQSEQAQYGIEPVNRYENQHNWSYPQEENRVEKNTFYPESKQYKYRKKSSWYEQSDHYKYDDFNSNVSPYTQVRQSPAQYYPMNDFNRDAQYPEEIYSNQYSNEQSGKIRPPVITNKMQKMKQRHFTGSFRKPVYASDFDADGYITNTRSDKMRPYGIPSSDVKAYYDWKNDHERQQVRIQYVPVPVYSVPGTLPGTIPGIVTPGDMVPGYSHLSPGYDHLKKNDKEIYDVMGSQYNPFSGFGISPGGSNPFNGLYKSYSNPSEKGWPFLSPDIMTPAFSKPETFLPY